MHVRVELVFGPLKADGRPDESAATFVLLLFDRQTPYSFLKQTIILKNSAYATSEERRSFIYSMKYKAGVDVAATGIT